MKKIILLLAALSFSAVSYCQSRSISLGVEGSLEFTKQHGTWLQPSISEPSSWVKTYTTFNIGVVSELPLNKNWMIRPELLFTNKGFQYAPGTSYITYPKVYIHYFELPINLAYGFKAGPGRLLAGAGPYIAFALSGKDPDGDGDPLLFGSSGASTQKGAAKRLDVGFNILLAYELNNNLFISADFNEGLTNILVNKSKASLYNRSFGIAIGYFFLKHKSSK